mgnify:CR=1 FL=1
MIKNFEDLTYELTNEELEKVDVIIKGLSVREGKSKAISGALICDKMNLTGVRLRKIIHYIRIKNKLYGLCSSSKGYYIASNITELNEYIVSFKQRIKSQVDVLNSLENQSIMFGGTGQLTIFE